MVALTQLALAALSLGVNVNAALPGWAPGVKWQIDIHEPIKHDSVKDFVPKEAVVFDIDMSHAQDYPDMIPMLKVRLLLARASHENLTNLVIRKPIKLSSAISMQVSSSPILKSLNSVHGLNAQHYSTSLHLIFSPIISN